MKKENKKGLIVIGILLGVGLVTKFLYKPKATTPPPTGTAGSGGYPNPGAPGRGLKNNNPLNIKLSSIGWQGKIPNSLNTDGTFEQFNSLAFGYRAAIKNLRTYVNNGINDLDTIIQTWAPDSTGAYQDFVKTYIGLDPGTNYPIVNQGINNYDPNMSLYNKDFTGALVSAMAVFENGQNSNNYVKGTESQFNQAWEML